MKKVFSTLLVAGFIALISCGQSAEEKAAQEKQMQDSIAAADQAANAMQEQQTMQDSANMMMDTSATKMAGDSAK